MNKLYTHLRFEVDKFTSLSANFLGEKITKAIDQRGFSIIGFSGGSTPGPIYEELGKITTIDWSKVFIFLVDERHIGSDNKDSNHYLINNTLLKNAKIPSSNQIFPNNNLPLKECIEDYENRINELFKKGKVDIMTLGMGPDGHLASLFPPVTKEGFSDSHLVIHTTTTQFAVKDRITVTMPVITQARETVFFLKGKDKEEVWNQMIQSEYNHDRWPVHEVLRTGNSTLISC